MLWQWDLMEQAIKLSHVWCNLWRIHNILFISEITFLLSEQKVEEVLISTSLVDAEYSTLDCHKGLSPVTLSAFWTEIDFYLDENLAPE